MTSPRGIALWLAALLIPCASCAAPSPPAPEPAPAAAASQEAPRTAEKPPAPTDSREVHSPRRLLDVPLDRARPAGAAGAELWFTRDQGQNWTNHGAVDVSRPSAPFQAPADGRYGFLLVPVGPDGRREFTPKSGDGPVYSVVVDTAPPVVEVLAPNGGEVLGGGRSTVVRWSARDANLAPAGVRLELSTEAGGPWITLAKDLPNTGTYHWDIPMVTSAHCRVRVVARDLAGHEGADVSDGEFTIDGLPPDLRIEGPASAREVPVRLEWSGGDVGGAGLKRVSLYVTRDGGRTWKHHGDDEDLKSPFLFQDLDGVYGLRLVGEDRMGNAPPAPAPGTPPAATLVLDRTPPAVKLLSPQAGGYLGGVPLDVRWSARDNLDMPANGVSIHLSEDDGKTWTEIARGLPNEGVYRWVPPKAEGTSYRLKVAAADFAGNVAEAVSDRFGLDATVPEARAVGPDRSGSHSVQVLYEIKNRGTAPIRRVTLYYRPENVKEWLKYGDDPDAQSPMLFAKADGRYALYLTCATEQGLRDGPAQRPPDEGTEPQLVLTIDATPPQITLETFTGGGYVRAGTASDIVWRILEANPDARGLSIFHSPDGGGTWNVVATDVDPARGAYRWVVPPIGGARHKIRVVAQDRFGHRAQAESERPFTIDGEPPTVTLSERPSGVSRAGRLAVKYKASDLTSGVERVTLYGRPATAAGPYRVLAESRVAEGTIETDVPGEGLWAFLVAAVDGAGNPSVEPERAPKPDFVVGFDRTPPKIELRSFALPQGTRTYLNGNWEVEWTASDTFSPSERLAVRLEYSADGGRTWFVAVARHANTGRADLRTLFLPGKRYRLRAVAIDEAGNEGEDLTADFDPGDVPPPTLTLRGLEDGRQYPLGAQVQVVWASPDRTIREASLELSKDGGQTWSLWAALSTSSLRVTLPDREGRYHARVTARDSVNRPISSNYVAFEVVTGVEAVRLITYPSVEAGKLVRVLIEPKAVFRSARGVRLEISEDGTAWRSVYEPKGPDVTFLAPAVAGEYVLRAVVTGPDGRAFESSHAKLKVVAAEGAGGIKLLNFRGGEAFAGGRGQVIQLRTAAPLGEIEVAFSDDGGVTWKPVSRENLTPVSGGLLWKPLPSVTSARCRLRVSYREPGGRTISDASEKDFAIDSTRPVGEVTGPSGERPAPVRLEYKLYTSEASAPDRLLLYVTEDGGRTWGLHQTYDPSRPVEFAPPRPGEYGLFLVVRTTAGLQGDPPAPGARPQAVVRVRGGETPAAPPAAAVPALLTEFPATLKGGSSVNLRWTSGESAAKATLSLVADGKSEVIARDLPASGSLSWTVPRVDARDCRVVLEVGGREARSAPFEIDSSPPRIEAVELELPRR